jgi:DNA-binding GntR family transcriptional regulator
MNSANNETLQAQVGKHILDAIERESLKPGGILPSEAELEITLNAIRTTIRAALIDLQLEDYIIRKQGKEAERIDFSERPLYKAIASLGFQINDGAEIMELSFADTVQAGLLQAEIGFPLFKTTRRVMGKGSIPFKYSISYTRGDRHRGIFA